MRKSFAILAFSIFASFGANAGFAQSDVLDGKAAKKMLFSHRGSDFVIRPQDFMGDADVSLLNLMANMKEFKSVLYYGAIAASPKDGLTHKATIATSNHHTPEAANRAALKECNSMRKAAVRCVVVAQILPKKYSEGAFSLSASATAAFKKTYLRGKGLKALAISPTLGSYGVFKGEDAATAALAACSADGATDCVVVVQD
ncbi:hypothetical protein JI58_05415 [Marinosulfonomonas sp. PRT-SC04]|nr:hypothetical protein JI58_05415 [Marinosulfonomonas sp. PRT-SC04]